MGGSYLSGTELLELIRISGHHPTDTGSDNCDVVLFFRRILC